MKDKDLEIEYIYKEISEEELDRIFFKIFDLIFSKGGDITAEKNKNFLKVGEKALSENLPVGIDLAN